MTTSYADHFLRAWESDENLCHLTQQQMSVEAKFIFFLRNAQHKQVLFELLRVSLTTVQLVCLLGILGITTEYAWNQTPATSFLVWRMWVLLILLTVACLALAIQTFAQLEARSQHLDRFCVALERLGNEFLYHDPRLVQSVLVKFGANENTRWTRDMWRESIPIFLQRVQEFTTMWLYQYKRTRPILSHSATAATGRHANPNATPSVIIVHPEQRIRHR